MDDKNKKNNQNNYMLFVDVLNVVNIPPTCRELSKLDPYINLIYKGLKKKTSYKKSDLNPVWNEKLEFDLKTTQISPSDFIEVELKDYETIGTNKLLAKGVVPLSQLINSGSLKYQVQLTDLENNKLESTKLFLNLEYKRPGGGEQVVAVSKQTPNVAAEKIEKPSQPAQIPTNQTQSNNSNDFLEPTNNASFPYPTETSSNDQTDSTKFARQRKENIIRSTKAQDFQIRVRVYQARQLEGNNINPKCQIKCSQVEKFTKTMRSTNSPFWNEIFFFNFNKSPAELFEQSIEFNLFNSTKTFRNSSIGSFKLEIGYVYDEPGHSLVNKWLLLSDAEDCMAGAKGYLKVSINVLGPGDEVPTSPEPSMDDDLESNLLKPAGIMLRPATFVMKCYRAEDLPRMDSNVLQGIKSFFSSNDSKKELVDPYVTFSFAGRKVDSKIVYNNANPEWNQELKIGLKFPSMCDKIIISVKDWDLTSEDDLVVRNLLDLNSISNFSDTELGFLPTFGPCFMNMYGSPREYSELPSCLEELNLGKGEGVAYRGRLLFEIQTYLGEVPTSLVSDIKHTEVLRIEPYLRRNKFKLHAAFFDATMIAEIEKPIEFEISIGNYGNKLDENILPMSSTTPPCNPVFDGCAYYFLPWGDTKPCMQITSFWEDIGFRIEALNQINKLKTFIDSCISKIKFKISLIGENSSVNWPEMSNFANQILDMIKEIKYKASVPLAEAIPVKHHPNDLDKHLRHLRVKYLSHIVTTCDKLPTMELKSVFDELQGFSNQLNQLEQEPQNSIPDVIIWMLCGNERTAYYRIPANQIMYSSRSDGRGSLCGVIQTVTLKWPGKIGEDKNKRDVIPARVRAKFWLGLEKDETEWLASHANPESNGAVSIYAETYENQTYSFTASRWTYDGLSRPSFSDSTGKVALQREKFALPPDWEWASEWQVAPELSLLFDKDAGHSQFMEEVYEQNYRNIPGASWLNAGEEKKPFSWANYKGEKSLNKEKFELHESWKWTDEWTVDINRAVDNEGWEYCVEPSMGGWSPTEKIYHLNRRRRWNRNRSLIQQDQQEKSVNKKPEALKSLFLMTTPTAKRNEVEESLKEGWEYSKLFSTKFHAKEQSTDTVRRRRWHRLMRPVGKNPDLTAVFRFQATEKIDDKKSAEMIKLSVPRMFLKYKKMNRYQLRAYIYQARSLPAADSDTSLSDPFCNVVFLTQSMKTEIKYKTLSPTWDQCLIFDAIEIHGDPSEVEKKPPEIMIEVFDHDTRGEPDFLGRSTAKPIVRNEQNGATRLDWFVLNRGGEEAGELLACFELFLINDETKKVLPPLPPKKGALYTLPAHIRPELQRTVIEVLCWGLRNMKTFQLSDVDCPQVVFECGDSKLESEILKNLKRSPNFNKPVLYFDVMIPKEEAFIPPMNIKIIDHRHFGRKPVVGVHTIKSLLKFKIDKNKEENIFPRIEEIQNVSNDVAIRMEETDQETNQENSKSKKKSKKSTANKKEKKKQNKCNTVNKEFGNNLKTDLATAEKDIDWWCKFYASLGDEKMSGAYLQKGYEKLTICNEELENEKSFECFTDFCDTFELVRGKTNNEEENEIVGEFKGSFKVYSIDENSQSFKDSMLLKNVQAMDKEECLLRVYVVRGIDLQPKDSNGKSDPYIQLECGKVRVDNRDSYIPNTNNPVFGRMFELKVTLPLQKDLCIRVKDFDLLSSDEIIGETWIDLENRLLTRHRATCGLPAAYNQSGANQWRDSLKPSQILSDLCKKRNLEFNIPRPGDTTLKIDSKIFNLETYEPQSLSEQRKNVHLGEKHERLCLHVLNELDLVKEHVETRKLFNPIQPGLEQGRLQMWVDIFPRALGPPGPPFDISQRKPKRHVLRCVVWNTTEVPLEEVSAISGERMSDIYVKGWLQGLDEDRQRTDVHYRSMDGDGNFNWRFTFDFDYLPTEQNLVIKKKEHFWSLDETESKQPPVFTVQIWDNDKFSADDFLGEMSLNLNSMIKPAKDALTCGLHQLTESKLVSLFEQRRLKGWWPCVVQSPDNKHEMAGKVELELEILSEDEAAQKPAGRGREEPNQNPKLEPPVRPETSFLWFASPLRTFKHIMWRRYKWWYLLSILLLVMVLFAAAMIYTLPSALWGKIL